MEFKIGDMVSFVKDFEYSTMPFEDVYEIIKIMISENNKKLIIVKNIRTRKEHGGFYPWRFKLAKNSNKRNY